MSFNLLQFSLIVSMCTKLCAQAQSIIIKERQFVLRHHMRENYLIIWSKPDRSIDKGQLVLLWCYQLSEKMFSFIRNITSLTTKPLAYGTAVLFSEFLWFVLAPRPTEGPGKCSKSRACPMDGRGKCSHWSYKFHTESSFHFIVIYIQYYLHKYPQGQGKCSKSLHCQTLSSCRYIRKIYVHIDHANFIRKAALISWSYTSNIPCISIPQG